ncbi:MULTISPECIES: excalibur calcium-binding domain-containing protein [Priestia]|uniref:excalibur calcium-binding domain-containing protein n=1 Tax=Priestia TaxID=2800373 RepID=UPI001C8D74A4|nr:MULTISPECIES: excalibur calcium-binding domain-containing protein [Priestia]MBX9986806.1 excalibur calcium-binding domain-containing protein [Priestia aryabhattai]UYV55178.1 excalibur calcium-binding domain-containing protein [Priestia megaterium]
MIAVIGLLSVFIFVVFLIWGLIQLARKKKSKKYFIIALVSFILFAILATVDGSKEEEQQVVKKESKVEKKATPTATSGKPTLAFTEAAAIVYKMVGVEEPDEGINKSKFIKENVMKGYLATKMKKHVYTFAEAEKSGEWVQVTFDDNDKVVKKVEMSPNLEKKVVASANKEKAAETAKKEEAQKKADEQKKQEEAQQLEEQKAKEEAQAKAEEEKRKQEEAARIAEEKRVAEQKQKEQVEADQAAQAQQQQQTQTVFYKNCTEARAAGAVPVYQGQPGYAKHLDRDGDGVGCDQ